MDGLVEGLRWVHDDTAVGALGQWDWWRLAAFGPALSRAGRPACTEIVFGLCAVLGFRFIPRIRDLPGSRLHVPGDPATWPTLEPVIGGRLRERVIVDNWPDIQRLVASIRAGVVPPSHLAGKLAARPWRSGLARALHEIGRLERTLFTLDLLRSPALRHRIQAGLNKGEAGNNLRRAVFFHRLGQVRDRAYEDQRHRARGLNLLVAAIVLWNTRYLGPQSPPYAAGATPSPTRCSRMSGRCTGSTSTSPATTPGPIPERVSRSGCVTCAWTGRPG